jgi:hypothetical protein
MKFLNNLTLSILLISGSLTQLGFAIGDQHGVFRSQSTQGAQWMGSATIEDEEIRMTVHANYVDVELDWVFRVGGERPAKFQDALEIVGNLNLAKGSVVVGMLTWWKGDILKGKLKTTQMARADYENVVQRDADAPPPPRDPVLLEYGWGIDNYDISIFPATFGETRKVRIHYLVPALSEGGVLKIAYPSPFSEKAKVFIKAGADIASYKMESWNDAIMHANKTMEAITVGERFNAIIPVLANEGKGSRFFVGDVTTPFKSGQVAQIVVMDAQKIIIQSDLKEDFVILWRWNHTRLLERYAGQIVSQSKLLQAFLAKLESANKRAALIVDKEGGERITFNLSKFGDAEHKKMMAYLASLAATTVLEPPVTKVAPNYQVEADGIKAQNDFEAAIQAAMSLFEKNDNIRHLLLLTAGPQIMYSTTNPIPFKLDSTIQLVSLVDYAEGLTLDKPIRSEDRMLYWPGINPSSFLSQQTLNLTIEAVVSNGNQLCTLSVASKPDGDLGYQGAKSETEKHVFTSTALVPKVNWKISQENKVIASFEEIPKVVRVENSNAFSKILGASRALTPMAPQMPRSMAATFGFIDSSYSLVALEEDKLNPAEVIAYANSGVPDLSATDIKATASDFTSLSSEEWLKENPPQRLWNYAGYYSRGGFGFNRELVFMDFVKAAPGGVPVAVNAGAFMPMPMADRMDFTQTASYPDYSKDLALGILPIPKFHSLLKFARVNGSNLILDMTQVNPTRQGKVEFEIYSLNGALIYSRSIVASTSNVTFDLSLSQMNCKSGLYLVQVKSASGLYKQKVLIP